MSWLTDLAGRAESLLNNLDEQTGQALRGHNVKKTTKQDKTQFSIRPNTLYTFQPENDFNWAQKPRRPIPRNTRQSIVVNETKSAYQPVRKGSPTRNTRALFKDSPADTLSLRIKKSSPRKLRQPNYNLNNCPHTMVNDHTDEIDLAEHHLGTRQRRRSVPSDLDTIMNDDCEIPIRMQNLEVENAMLKNELNVMNREVAQMLERLKGAEEGNNVDINPELGQTRLKLKDSELHAHKSNQEKESLDYQLKLLKEKIQEIAMLEKNYRGEKQMMITENSALKDANNYLEDRVNDLKKNLDNSNAAQQKVETELRHAQTTISELQTELEKSKAESQRLEKDWDTYKIRVKSMLSAKDNEIKAIQEGINFSEEAKILVEQLDSLRMERDELSEAICTVRSECDGMRACLSQVESRHTAAERVVAALRDALKEERAVRNRAESQLFAVSKEMKNMQTENGQTIASLRTALRDKEAELTQVRGVSSSYKSSSDTSALNVADYDVTQDSFEKEKIHYLTETLVQKQARVDKLLSENNMLKIQMDKLESKLKAELQPRTASNHSFVNVQNVDARTRRVYPESLLSLFSHRMAGVMRRHPMLRIFIVLYMICLHFWVLAVLLTSTPPENLITNFSRT